MLVVAGFNACLILLLLLSKAKHKLYALQISFALIFVFLALRYDYGNDYPGYLDGFLEINYSDSIDYFDSSWRYELGWILLCRVFRPVGFFALVAACSLFHCCVFYRFIRKYVPPRWYWFAVLLYTCKPEFMLIQCSAIRQSIAIAFFLLAIECLIEKLPIRYVLCVVLASLFHTSALYLMPAYLLTLVEWRIPRLGALVILSCFVCLVMMGAILEPLLIDFLGGHFPRYAIYKGQGGTVRSGLGIVFSGLLLAIVLSKDRFHAGSRAVLFKLAALNLFILPIGLIIAMVARMGMYCEPATLAVYPIILTKMKPRFSPLLLGPLIVITLYSFYGFFHSEVWGEYFATYKTILSSPHLY